MGKLNEDRFSSNDRSFSHLDPPAVKQMYQVMIKIRGIGRSIESEEPFSDNVSPAIRRMAKNQPRGANPARSSKFLL